MEAQKQKDIVNSLVDGRKKNLASHIYLLFWEIQDWTAGKWKAEGWTDINPDQLKLIYLLSAGHQLSNNTLANLAGVTKQAASQMVATLAKRGVLKVEQDPADSRAKLISLSEYGVQFIAYLASSTDELMKEYTEIIGQDKMKTMTDISMELAEGILKGKSISNEN